jgi:hypothetical protein
MKKSDPKGHPMFPWYAVVLMYPFLVIDDLFHKRATPKQENKKLSSCPLPWYAYPLAIIVLPIYIIRNIFRGKYDTKGDPHDISGEPDSER